MLPLSVGGRGTASGPKKTDYPGGVDVARQPAGLFEMIEMGNGHHGKHRLMRIECPWKQCGEQPGCALWRFTFLFQRMQPLFVVCVQCFDRANAGGTASRAKAEPTFPPAIPRPSRRGGEKPAQGVGVRSHRKTLILVEIREAKACLRN